MVRTNVWKPEAVQIIQDLFSKEDIKVNFKFRTKRQDHSFGDVIACNENKKIHLADILTDMKYALKSNFLIEGISLNV